MTDEIHYVPAGFGYKQYAVPLVADTRFDPDRVIILEPTTGHDTNWYTEEVKNHLAGHDIEVEEKNVETDSFVSIVRRAYGDLLDDLEVDRRDLEGNEVYINTASQYWAIGAGYATAASLLIAEKEDSDDDDLDTAVADLRERLTIYYTEPAEYRLDELLITATQMRTLQREFRTAADIAKQRKGEIGKNKETVDTLLELLEASNLDLDQALELIIEQYTTLDSESEIVGAMEEVFQGLEQVTAGIRTLDEHKEELPAIGPLTDIGEGLAELSADAERDDGELTPVDLLDWVQGRLGDVNTLATKVADQYDELDEKMDRPPEELFDFVEDIKSEGIAHGVRTFDGAHHMELPGPLQFELTATRRAILYTLRERGEAGSYVELAIAVNQMALEHAPLFSDDMPDDERVDAFRTMSAEQRPDLWTGYLESSTRQLVKDNVERLEEMGFVKIDRVGKPYTVELTRAGDVYANSKELDDEWRREAFEDIYETVSRRVTEFIEENSS